MFDGICEAIHREMDQLDEKFAGGVKMNAQELDNIDKMSHALKCIASYEMLRDTGHESSYSRYKRRY